MNGGYVILDLDGVDLYNAMDNSPPTNPNLGKMAQDAFLSGKPIFLYNCKINGSVLSPFSAFARSVVTGEGINIVINIQNIYVLTIYPNGYWSRVEV